MLDLQALSRLNDRYFSETLAFNTSNTARLLCIANFKFLKIDDAVAASKICINEFAKLDIYFNPKQSYGSYNISEAWREHGECETYSLG